MLVIIIAAHLVLFVSPETLDVAAEFLGVTTPLSDSLEGYKHSFDVFLENIFLGSGLYAEGEYNLLLGIGLKAGIFAVAIFIIMIMIRHRHISYYRSFVRNCGVEVISNMSALSIFTLMILGVWSPVILDVSMIYLFFSLFDIGAAALRAAKKENDDRLGYYSDSRSAESSALDIEIAYKE